MNRPNFFVVGMGKAGTTSLYRYLKQHPEVYLPLVKEPRYFSFKGRRPEFSGPLDEELVNNTTVYERGTYYALFDAVTKESAVGEISPSYIHLSGCATAIHEELPDAKIILILRNPAQVAYSAYLHMVRVGIEPLDFDEAISLEESRVQLNWAWHWHYKKLGLISSNIQEYIDIFGREKLLFIKYEDFKVDNQGVLKSICRFLGVDDTFKFESTVVNTSDQPTWKLLHRVYSNPSSIVNRFTRIALPLYFREKLKMLYQSINLSQSAENFDNNDEERLKAKYKTEIIRWQEMTGLSLSDWLE